MTGMARGAVLALACVLLPASASAQLGKLKKKATDAASSAAGVPTTPPRYVKKVNLTSAQLAQVNRGLAEEVKVTPGIIKQAEEDQKNYEKAQEKYRKDYDAYSKADEKYRACRERVIEEARPQQEALAKKGEASTPQVNEAELEELGRKAQAAAQKVQAGTATAADRQVLADFQKYMANISAQTSGAMAASNESVEFEKQTALKVDKTCGGEPVKPVDPKGGAKMAQEQIADAGAAAAGVPRGQWYAWRDELIGLASSNTKVQAGSDTPEAEANAVNEQIAVAQGHLAEMKKAGVPY